MKTTKKNYRNLNEEYSELDNEILIICGDWDFVQILKLTITTICILITLVPER